MHFVLVENQGAELMSKYGVNVPKGVAVATVDEVKKTIESVFPNQSEVIIHYSHSCCWSIQICFYLENVHYVWLLVKLRKELAVNIILPL